MKKFFAGFGLVLITLTVYAFSQISNVHNIGDKDVNGTQESQKIVTASEFNSLVNTVRGINVNKNGSKYEMGLGTNPISGVDLTIGGMLKIDKESDSSKCNAVGTIFYNKDNKHFWGCQSIGNVPVRLDVDECTSVNAVCGTTHNNCVSGTFKTGSDNATSTEYTWTCSGISGGVDANCTELIPVNGVCKEYISKNGFTNQPATDNVSGCMAGTYVDMADGTTWNWSCNGINGGTNANCSASRTTPVQGLCDEKLILNKCKQGTLDDIADSGTDYLWNCVGSGGGATANCVKPKP